MPKEMSSWLRNGRFNEKDEYYTPECLVKAIIPFVIERFYRNAVLMFKDSVEQCPIRVSTGVSHDQHLEWC